MKIILLLFLVLNLTAISQSKKYYKLLSTKNTEKLSKLKEEENFQNELDYWLVESIHTYDSTLLLSCIESGANPNNPCNNCYDRNAIMIALFYQNYYTYEKLKPLYNHVDYQDELGYNILFAAASCKNEILEEVIETYKPAFLVTETKSNPLYFCDLNNKLIIENFKTLFNHYQKDITKEVINYRSDNEMSILQDAVFFDNIEVVKYLISKGAEPFLMEGEYNLESEYIYDIVAPPFIHSMALEDRSIYDYLMTLNPKDSDYQNWKILPYDEVESENDGAVTSCMGLFIAANKNIEFAKELIERYYPEMNYYDINEYLTPMLIAIIENNTPMVELIIGLGWNGMYYKVAQKWAKDKEADPKIRSLIDNFIKDNFK